MKTVMLLIVGVGVSSPAWAAPAIDVQEGDWETSGDAKIEGLPIQMPPVPFKFTTCVLKEDLVPKTDDKACVSKEPQVSGTTVSWKATCKDAQGRTTEQTGTVTYDKAHGASRFDGSVVSTMGPTKTTARVAGRRLGPCSDKSRAERDRIKKAPGPK